MPKIDIRPDHWEMVRGILHKHVPQHEVWAFGSRATWTAKEFSDLDLAVIGDKPLSLSVSSSLSDDFSESDLPYKVDVVDWATTSESFQKIIERDRVVVQKAGRSGAMQPNWRDVTLGEFVRLQRGHDLTASEQRPGPFPVMGSAGPNGTHEEFKAFGQGVVIGRSGASMGQVHYCETDYWPHNTCLYVTDFLGNHPLFAFYKLAELDLARYNSGSAQPSLNRNHIYGLSLRIPSRRIQDKIVDVVRSIDQKIRLNRRINQTLEAMAQALFKSWFVDFDPVKAKIAAKQQWLAKHAAPPLPLGEGPGVRAPPTLTPFARENRQNATDAEMLMWRLLRGKQLGAKFRRQHPVGSYILDFYCHDHRLAIELDGSQHYLPQGMAADEERSQMLAVHGIRVLRFSNREVLLETEGVMERVWQAITLTPTPLPEGEGLQAAMQRAAMSGISGMGDAELDALKLLPSPSGRGAGGEGSLYDQLAATAALFPDEMEDSELREIPKGWRAGTFKECCLRVESGGTPSRKKPPFWDGTIPWLTSGEVRDVVVLDTKEKITQAGLDSSNAKLWPAKTTVVAMYGATAGQVCLIAQEMTANQACCALIPKAEFRTFIFVAARQSVQQLAEKASSSAQQNLNKSLVENHAHVIPSRAVAEKFEMATSEWLQQWILNQRKAATLSALRDTLLPKLLSGELSVTQAMAEVEA